MTPPSTATIRRDDSFRSGRLIAYPTRTDALGEPFAPGDLLSIDFPAMPDSVELARSTDYLSVSPFGFPDGIHMYKGTRPMEIPFSFRLHAFDEQYCPNGAYTLLQLAARLHSFVLPIDNNKNGASSSASVAKGGPVTPGTGDSQLEKQSASSEGTLTPIITGGANVFAPVACRLELIFTEQLGIGVCCDGYVKEVNVKLNGPWMRGPGRSSNLPSSADFSFVFVHKPGFGNLFTQADSSTDKELGQQPQAYAHTVMDKFYNTVSLATARSYQGLQDVPTVTTEQPRREPTVPGSRIQQQIRSIFGQPSTPQPPTSSLTPVGFDFGR